MARRIKPIDLNEIRRTVIKKVAGKELHSELAQMASKIFPMKMSIFILWLLKKKKLHGYEIIKILRGGGFKIATASRIYPILKIMSETHLIEQRIMKQGLRVKKVYNITEKGKTLLQTIKKWICGYGLVKEFLREMTR